MTRDSAAVAAALDDRRRRRSRCPVPAAASDSDVPLPRPPPPDDDASSSATNGPATGGSSSSDAGGGGDGGGCGSPKSSSTSTSSTGRGGGSSSGGGSSRSGSDDDDSGAAAVRPSDTSPTPSLPKDPAAAGDEEPASSCGDGDEAPATDASTSIGGRLTFYKDGQFIFQLAAHHQHPSYNNQSAATAPCRWVPVPTVMQQHKNNVKKIGEWPQNQQNKTIWPYLVTSPAPAECKSPQPASQSQPSAAKTGERKQYQHRTTPPPLTPIGNAVNVASCTTAVVMATTTTIVRRPSRKCSTTAMAENATDGPHWKLESQPRAPSKRAQPYQHQSFVMVATRAIKAQRRLLSLANKQRRRSRKTMRDAAMTVVKESLSLDHLKLPSVNLEYVVRNLWCRRHTTELLRRRQMSLNNCGAGADTVDSPSPAAPRHSSADSAGNGKRRSVFSPVPATDLTVPAAASMITDGMTGSSSNSSSSSSSPSKKYRLGQQQQQQQQHQRAPSTTDHKIVRKPVAPSPNNDHSITAILSGGAAGAKRGGGGGVVDSENCHITSTTCGGNTVMAAHPQKIPPLSSPAPLSLLRTLLKSPGGEMGPSPVAAVSHANGVYKHNHSGGGGRKRSAATESPPAAADNGACRPAAAAAAATASSAPVNDAAAAAAALNALHRLPAALHHPSTVAAAAGYFNVLYHQAAMAAAAMAYQTHAQLPKSPQQPGPSLQQQQFQASNSWKRQPNRRPPSSHPTAAESVAGVASTVVAPYSSPLAAVNGSLLPPATPSPPPFPPHSQPPAHGHHRRRQPQFLHHQQQQQQYQPVQVPAVQQKPPSPYHHHHHHQQQQQPPHHRDNKRRPQGSGGVKLQRTAAAEYGDRVGDNSVGAAVDVDSSPSADCVPLNLSKDSVAENIGDTTAIVR